MTEDLVSSDTAVHWADGGASVTVLPVLDSSGSAEAKS